MGLTEADLVSQHEYPAETCHLCRLPSCPSVSLMNHEEAAVERLSDTLIAALHQVLRAWLSPSILSLAAELLMTKTVSVSACSLPLLNSLVCHQRLIINSHSYREQYKLGVFRHPRSWSDNYCCESAVPMVLHGWHHTRERPA